MKKLTALFLGVLLVLSLSACTPTPEKEAETTAAAKTAAEAGTAAAAGTEAGTAAAAGTEAAAGTAAAAGTEAAAGMAATEPVAEMSTGGASDKVPDPNVEPMEIISVYSANEDATGLNQAMDAVDELTAQSLVDKLIEYGVLEEGTEALKFDMDKGIGTLDLSKVPTGGTSGETLMLTAIGNTFTENFELDKLKLLVNGRNYSSGHIQQGDSDYLEYNRSYKKL